jgi:hypothetical protein
MTGAQAHSMKLTPRHWDHQDLEARLCHALDVAKRAVDRLAEHGYADPDESRDQSCDPVRPEKVISEAAILLLAASTASARPPVRVRVHELAHLLIPHARSERMRLGLCLQPALALDYASAHVCLKRAGYPDPGFDGLLDQALKSQAVQGRERVPHRMLEQEWLLEHCGGTVDPRRRAFALRHSALSFPLDLLACSRDDIYAFTHALMYVTDFNLAPRRLPRPRKTILPEADALLAGCLDDEDYDLGGEVLLSWPLTGTTWSPTAAFAFRVLADAEDAAGFLPAPITRLKRLNELEGDSRADYLLATAYHTIFVMGLLCAAALQPGRTPPLPIPARKAVHGSANRILSTLDADGRKVHWRDGFAQLSERERDALAGFLLIIALRRKTRQRDYAAVAGLLRQGHDLGLTDTPAGSQTAELLQRLATFSSLASRQQSA